MSQLHDSEIEETTVDEAGKTERLASLRSQLKPGKQFWKSFEELAGTQEFQQWVEDEFPNRKSLLEVDRRQFLTLGGAAFAMAGLSGCRILTPSKAVPYVRAPEELVTGKKMMYATALPRGGFGRGVLVESHEGRPTKIEGNPRHPDTRGASDVWLQAEALNLYDPDRAQSVIFDRELTSWDQFLSVLRQELGTLGTAGGAGFAILTETITSPVLGSQIRQLLARYPGTRWVQWDPVNRDNVHAGTRLAFGRPVNPVYRLGSARVIVSLDADFLLTMPGNLRYASDFASGRRVRASRPAMNRLYAIESGMSITGAMADNRLPVKPSEIETVARALYARVVGGGAGTGSPYDTFLDALARDLAANRGVAVVVPGDEASPAVHALAHGINQALGAVGSTVVYTAPVEVEPATQLADLRTLVADMNAGRVKALLIMGGNPVYNAPRDLGFSDALVKVPFSIRLGRYEDETGNLCKWQLPESHPLEAWGDLRAFDGTTSIVQPLIAPLYETRSAIELMAEVLGQPRPGYDIVRGFYEGQQGITGTPGAAASAAFDRFWEKVLVDGVVPNTAAPAVAVTAATGLDTTLPATPAPAGGQFEVVFRPDPTIWDGSYANNSWLQEIPKPLTTITWDNAALMNPRTAKAIGIIPSDAQSDIVNISQATGKRLVSITVGGATLKQIAVWVQPGVPDNTVVLHLGYGRTMAGSVGNGQGFDTYQVRLADGLHYAAASITPAAGVYQISVTQPHHTLRADYEEHNRDIVRAGTIEEFEKRTGDVVKHVHVPHAPEATAYGTPLESQGHGEGGTGAHGEGGGEHKADGSGGGEHNVGGHNQTADGEIIADWYRKQWRYTDKSQVNKEGWPSLYPEYSGKGYNQWGMVIDHTTCIGCNACVAACQAENNIPTVGKEQVGKGREMHWLRIDTYYATGADDLEEPEILFQPMLCVHCEKAPCEPVCPVAATVHSHEGLNQMIYNRCVGTRYCSNNCPYKVRRYNFLKWTQAAGGPTTLNFVELPVLKLLNNPEVTVRGRGVMEKCTYCVQRINSARIEAKKEQREIRDGEVITACQQACPTQTIFFGDINNPNSVVSRLKREPHDYGVLSELNTRPRTTHLAKIRNPNPELKSAAEAAPRVRGGSQGEQAREPAATGAPVE